MPILSVLAYTMPAFCLIATSYFAGLAGASRARLHATKPLNDAQKRFISDTLNNRDHAEKYV